jgi:hypothetical protein
MLPGLHFLHAHLHWTLGSVCWLGLAVRTSAAMTGVADAKAAPPVPAQHRPACVVIDFPRARSKRFVQKPR